MNTTMIVNDTEEDQTILTIKQGRVSVSLRCYNDDDGFGVIDIRELLDGHQPRELAFVADTEDTKVYGLDQFGRTRRVLREMITEYDRHHPSAESVQRTIETGEYREER